MSAPEVQLADADPTALARAVATATDEQLAEGMRSELRGQILDEIFRRMEEHFEPSNADGLDAVIHFRISGRPDGGHDDYELIVRERACTVTKGFSAAPRVTLSIGSVEFLRLVSGTATGPQLFIAGRLGIRGDLLFAAQMAGLFRIPRPSG
jgi:putative sterol carrier protein